MRLLPLLLLLLLLHTVAPATTTQSHAALSDGVPDAEAAAARSGAGQDHPSATAGTRRSLQGAAEESSNVKHCKGADYKQLYETIHNDLEPWKQEGITAGLMDWLYEEQYPAYPLRYKAVGVVFQGGRPYLVTDPKHFKEVGHHKRLLVGHLALFQAMSRTFGQLIPDVEVVVATGDEPMILLQRYENGTNPQRLPPVLRFCKSKSFADILVPDIHFSMRNFTAQLLGAAANYTAAWPWDKKRPMLFGRFGPYWRAASKLAPELYRKGKGGKNICREASPELWFCDVRKHFVWSWARGAARKGLPVDVAQQPRKDMMYHASNKWLMHLDGQSCSSRLEQLLVLGSTVVKEESGYYAFFHHLLQPYKHYVPFWKELPEEALEAIEWAKTHDAQAADIAAAAQDLARRYLHKRALMCYWFTLLSEMSALLRYTPGRAGGDRKYPTWVPVDEYLDKEGNRELAFHKMLNMEFWD